MYNCKTNQKKNLPKMYISLFHEASSPNAVSWGSCHGENTVCAFKDFVLNRQISWN